MGRFDHIKPKKLPLTAEEFAAEADASSHLVAKRAKPERVKPLLTVVGKMQRNKDCGRPHQIYLRTDIQDDIARYCIGNMQGIINYLIRTGLTKLIQEDQPILEEMTKTDND